MGAHPVTGIRTADLLIGKPKRLSGLGHSTTDVPCSCVKYLQSPMSNKFNTANTSLSGKGVVVFLKGCQLNLINI